MARANVILPAEPAGELPVVRSIGIGVQGCAEERPGRFPGHAHARRLSLPDLPDCRPGARPRRLSGPTSFRFSIRWPPASP